MYVVNYRPTNIVQVYYVVVGHLVYVTLATTHYEVYIIYWFVVTPTQHH